MIGMGIYGLAIANDSTNQGYWLGALIVGVIWLIVNIIRIRHNKA